MQAQPSQTPVITLTTDFGLQDAYAGILKGVILSHCTAAQIIDITHGITPLSITSAALTIDNAYAYFPHGTIHIVVVDPGVGSERSILALRADKHIFIAPNNGVLTPLLKKNRFMEAFRIENSDLFLPNQSHTFHGRDIMAPVAGKIAGGLELSRVGPPLALKQCLRIHLPEATVTGGNIKGEIIAIDHFGNLQTSITQKDLTARPSKGNLSVTLCGLTIKGLSRTYSDQKPGALLALLDSRNHLEIAVSGGNAASELECQIGNSVNISYQ